MKYLLLLLPILASCDPPEKCIQRTMYLDYDINKPTGITAEQAMKICGVK
jgi:hypothetical protein